MCKYSDDTGYECPHKRLEYSDYCIFHLQDDNKDIDEFDKGLKDILEPGEGTINLNGFYFPLKSSDFSEQEFQNKIDFSNVIFSGDANFKGTVFSEDACFVHTEFTGGANFVHADFSEDVNFMHADFSGYATFGVAKFSGGACFINIKFSRNAYFGNVKFSGDTNFFYADFSKDALFEHADFSGHTTFGGAKFSGRAYFGNVKFSGKTIFKNTILLGETNFKDAELTGRFEFIPDNCELIIFENTYFLDDVRIKANLSKCSFANSNIERVDMTDSMWIVENKPKDSYKIWEERQGKLTSNWKELEGIYRRLKQSYQRFGDNDAAGNFYYREMECKRQQLKGAKKLFWDVFYKLLCGYGEKPFNVIWASILIILAASLFFFYWGIELLGSEVLNLTPRLINYDLSLNFQWVRTNFGKVFNDWLECLYTSVITFTTLGYGDVHPIGFSRIVASVEAGIGIIMTALFIFVFTRKMLR